MPLSITINTSAASIVASKLLCPAAHFLALVLILAIASLVIGSALIRRADWTSWWSSSCT